MEDKYKDLLHKYSELLFVIDYLDESVKKLEKLQKLLETDYIKQNEIVDKKTVEIKSISDMSVRAATELLDAVREQTYIQKEMIQESKDALLKLDKQTANARAISDELNSNYMRDEEFLEKLNVVYNFVVSNNLDKNKQKLISIYDMDHDTIFTGQDIYNQYYKKIDGPLLIKSIDWNGDYCFCVEDILISNGVPTHFLGRRFYNGKSNGNNSKTTLDKQYRIYDYKSLNEIIEFYRQLEE